MPTLYVIAHIRAKEGKHEELRAVLSGLVTPTRKESGCIRYQLFRSNADPRDFTFVEEWADDAALDQHLNTPHFQAASATFSRLVEGSPSIDRCSLLA